jgi:hypothetical protein
VPPYSIVGIVIKMIPHINFASLERFIILYFIKI